MRNFFSSYVSHCRPGDLFTSTLVLAGSLFLGACGGDNGHSASVNPDCGAWPTLYQLPEADTHSNIKSLRILDNCRILIAGYEGSSHPSEAEGNSRGFIRLLEVNDQGDIAESWTYWLDTSGVDAVTDLYTENESILFLGVTSGALAGQQNSGKKDVVVGRLTYSGEMILLSQLGNERPNIPLALLTTNHGSLILIGSDEPYIPTNYVERWEDPWMAGLNETAQGFEVSWWQNADTEQQDIYTAAMLQDGYLLLGRYTFNGYTPGMSVEARDLSGSLIWQRSLSNSPYDTVAGFSTDSSGQVLAYGTTYLALGNDFPGGGDFFGYTDLMVDGAPSPHQSDTPLRWLIDRLRS